MSWGLLSSQKWYNNNANNGNKKDKTKNLLGYFMPD